MKINTDYFADIVLLNGKMVLPSFSDTHIHPPGKFLIKLYGVYLYECLTVEDYIKKSNNI